MVPRYSARVCQDFGTWAATRSPGLTPRSVSSRATWFTRAAEIAVAQGGTVRQVKEGPGGAGTGCKQAVDQVVGHGGGAVCRVQADSSLRTWPLEVTFRFFM